MCSIVRPDLSEVQKSFGDLFRTVGDSGYSASKKAHDEVLSRLGINIKPNEAFYDALKVMFDALNAPSRCGIEELTKKAKNLVKAGKVFLESQKGLENFKTDQNQKDDPALELIHKYFDALAEKTLRLATNPESFKEYFCQENADLFGKFVMVVVELNVKENS